ncbi:uncharacterized protein LOC123693239 [Colias croceus]|uniref:uncharacterized protein LOC123693239 n=1 Tax=Colias crocea TaxID=72248 RepID=UPI001E27E9AF|nr:uncharacterized protein LOC123693239 [Colias croceus]
MVWWITRYKPSPSVCRSGSLCYYQSRDAEEDAVFPSTNIMFTFNNRKYSINEINYLVRSGVNIFNIDRTVHDQSFEDIQASLMFEAQNQTKCNHSKYYIPITLVITMSIGEPQIINNMES